MAETLEIASEELEVVIWRVIDAPRELVFRAWTEPKLMSKWWGPRDFTTPVCEVDLREGGAYRIVMRSPEGVDYPVKGIYQEIIPLERIVATGDCAEHPIEWQDALLKDLPSGSSSKLLESVSIVTFEEKGDKTLLTIRSLFQTAAVRDAMVKAGMNEGWSESLDRLEALLQTM